MPTSLVTLVAWVACLCAGAPAWAEYRTVETEGLRITFDSDSISDTAPGYLPVRLEIANVNEAREIEIVGVSRRFFHGRFARNGSLVTVRRSVRLARGGRVAFTMPMPIGFRQRERAVRAAGERARAGTAWRVERPERAAWAPPASAIIIAQPGSSFAGASAGWPRTMKPPGAMAITAGAASGSPRFPSSDYMLDPVRAPADWLGWTSTSAVFLGDGNGGR